ncbi:hypothetical protein M5689_000600 [Euphorbia peplus]|nr:hypothetical protein M5689_000600 [Euphorbia peplus]
MKKAKVSAIYEGRRRNGSAQEREMSSKAARMNARARKNSFRSRTLSYLAASKQWMVNKFSSTNPKDDIVPIVAGVDIGVGGQAIDVQHENTNNVNMTENTEEAFSEEHKDDQAGGEAKEAHIMEMNVMMEKWGEAGEWWDEWPLYWSYEEQNMWGEFGNNSQDDQEFILGNIWN